MKIKNQLPVLDVSFIRNFTNKRGLVYSERILILTDISLTTQNIQHYLAS